MDKDNVSKFLVKSVDFSILDGIADFPVYEFETMLYSAAAGWSNRWRLVMLDVICPATFMDEFLKARMTGKFDGWACVSEDVFEMPNRLRVRFTVETSRAYTVTVNIIREDTKMSKLKASLNKLVDEGVLTVEEQDKLVETSKRF